MGNRMATLVGDSAVMTQLRQYILKAAATSSNVLIEGESGTGKELVARALHAKSARAGGPPGEVNCGALPEPLLESEMFGHERGSFTELSTAERKIRTGIGRNIVSDEIGEMALSHPDEAASRARGSEAGQMSAVSGRYHRYFESSPPRIALSGLPSRPASFRRDLYYRLKVLPIKTPPLREHMEDIPAIVHHFILKNMQDGGRRVYDISDEVESILMKHDCRANVRELQNVMSMPIAYGSSDLGGRAGLPGDFGKASVHRKWGRITKP